MATKAEYWQRGEALDFKNETDATIANNTVIAVGSRIGVTGTVIEPGQTGSVHMTGVWEMKKTGTADIAMGQAVYFDGDGITDAAGETDAPNPAAGYAAAAAKAADTTILVKLCG